MDLSARSFEERRSRILLPFVAASLFGFVLLPLPPGVSDGDAVLEALLLTGILILAGLFVPWGRMPRWTHATVPLAYFAVIGLLRSSAGGVPTGYDALAMLPIFWLAVRHATAPRRRSRWGRGRLPPAARARGRRVLARRVAHVAHVDGDCGPRRVLDA